MGIAEATSLHDRLFYVPKRIDTCHCETPQGVVAIRTPVLCAYREEKGGGYGLPQPVTSVTGFAMTGICCLALRL